MTAIAYRRREKRFVSRGPRQSGIAGYAGVLALTPVLVAARQIWACQALLIVIVLSVPGLLLLRALRVPGKAVGYFPALIPCGSIIVLLASGLLLDLAGPVVGLKTPLRTVPVLVVLEAISAGLLWASRNTGWQPHVPWWKLSQPGLLGWPLLIPVLAAAGAMRLNDGHGNLAALAAVVVGITALMLCFGFSSRMEEPLLVVVLYAVGLSVMWAFSLRGQLVYGFDIATEYQRLTSTVSSGIWRTGHYHDAYGAMLSVTVMPAELHFISGLSPLQVFKVAYPLIGALFPVEVYGIARRVLSKTWSFLAASMTIAQTSFAGELPALARQEVALALFGALIAVLLSSSMRKRTQWSLAVLLGLGMVVSHYSTTYVTIAVLGGAVALQWVISWFRPIGRMCGAIALAFGIVLAGAFVWYGPVTDSATGVSVVADTVASEGLDILPARAPGESLIAAYFESGAPTLAPSEYEHLVHTEYALSKPSIVPLPDAGSPVYALRASEPAVPSPRPRLVSSGISLLALVAQEVLNLLGLLGSAAMVVRRKIAPLTRRIGLIGFGTSALLVLIRLSGILATFYNSERLLLQALGVFSIAFAWVLQSMSKNGERRRRMTLLAMLFLLVVYSVNTSGLSGAVLGGGTSANLANSGENYERFYRTDQELAAAAWLGKQLQPGQLVYADTYAQLPLAAMTGLGQGTDQGVLADVTPLTINQHAWIYASTANIVDGRNRVDFDGKLATYQFPFQFLNGNFDIVYSDGASEVYYR